MNFLFLFVRKFGLLLMFSVFFLPRVFSHIDIVKSVHELDEGLYILSDSNLYIPGEDGVSLFGPFEFQVGLRNISDSSLHGYLTFENEYFMAYNWRLLSSEDSTFYPELANELYVTIPPHKDVAIRFTVDEVDRMSRNELSLTYLSSAEWENRNRLRDITQAIFLSIFSFLSIFNLIIYFVSKWRVHAKYALYILSALLYLLYYFGYLQRVFPGSESVSVNAVSVFYSVIFVLYFWFLNDLGDYKNTVPKAALFLKVGIWYKLIHVMIELPMLLAGWSLITHPVYRYTFLIFEVGLMSLIIFHIVKARDFRGRIVIAGSLLLIIAAIFAQLDTGLDRALVLECGILAELMLFSVGMGYISRRYYEEKNEVQLLYVEQLKQNEKILKNVERDLEQKVMLRTNELRLEKQKVEAKNHENTVLLREIHHRVKNNLQMISSMLSMQERRMDQQGMERVQEAANRINIIGLLHEHLYQQSDQSAIQLKPYVEGLCSLVRDSMSPSECELNIEVIGDVVSATEAIYGGLILNELIVNSFKHASPENQLRVWVKVKDTGDQLRISVLDNGISQRKKDLQKGFGLTLIETLLQGEGELVYHVEPRSFLVEVFYRKEEYELT